MEVLPITINDGKGMHPTSWMGWAAQNTKEAKAIPVPAVATMRVIVQGVCDSCARRQPKGALPEEEVTAAATAWLPTVDWKTTATATTGGGAPDQKPASRAKTYPRTPKRTGSLKSHSAQNQLRVPCLQQGAGMLLSIDF